MLNFAGEPSLSRSLFGNHRSLHFDDLPPVGAVEVAQTVEFEHMLDSRKVSMWNKEIQTPTTQVPMTATAQRL